ncbi:hypothetical protein [Halanaerobium hydrogeniformans]|uniref:UbiA prenyltransferase n=1 Tax=Halanaerobium hydrogeniformans TaxID=656519 RepID=E4RIH4_HALHG|nr:hypothetical protein [Halanaerobium hydrogeniformans]ADQ15044.1 hypothetical protein Halsa_1619 [Halanaerobium hydrogeniformans]
MSIKENTLIYKLYYLSLKDIWLDILLPILLGAALALNLSSQFNIIYLLITLFTLLVFIIAANSWIQYFFDKANLYQFIYQLHFLKNKKKSTAKYFEIEKKELFLIAIIFTLLTITLIFFTINISNILFILIISSLLLFFLYIFLQVKIIDSYFDEFIIGLLGGPMLISISYIIHSGEFNLAVILLSLPIALFIINLRWVSQHNNKYSFKGFKVLLLLIYASFALIFSYYNNVLFLLLYISLPFVMTKIKNKENLLSYNKKYKIVSFSRKLYYYSTILLITLLILDYITSI